MADFLTYLADKRAVTLDFLSGYLITQAGAVSSVSPLAQDAVRRLSQFTSRGKLIRAALTFLGTETGNAMPPAETVTALAGAMELFQSGLLIHDDIMDRDELRRGQPSMHAQYTRLSAQKTGAGDPHMGESLATCVGDASFFLGYALLARMQMQNDMHTPLLRMVSGELAAVTAAQMQDVMLGGTGQAPTEQDIVNVYRYKTGRYSCGLPLAAGALLAEAPEKTIGKLWKLGEAAGLLFQMTDDRLNLFGNPQETGKPVSSDIREGKWTLYRLFLMQRASEKDRQRLTGIFGNPAIGEEEAAYVRSLVESTGAGRDVDALLKSEHERALEIISHLPAGGEWKGTASSFIAFLAERRI